MLDDKVLDQTLRRLHDAGLDDDAGIEMERRVAERVAHGMTAAPASGDRRLRRVPGRRRRRRALGLGVALFGALAVGGGAYAVLSPQPAKLSSGLACFENADRSGAMAAAQFDGRTAIAICSELWRKGEIVSTPAGQAPAAIPPVPELQACSDPTNKLAVQVIPSPSPSVCAKYGLISQPDVGADSTPYATLSRVLNATLVKHCLSEARARAVAHAALATANMPSDWKVISSEGLPAGVCITISADSNAHTLTLRPGESPIDNPTETTPAP
jgi:hypothetical protein